MLTPEAMKRLEDGLRETCCICSMEIQASFLFIPRCADCNRPLHLSCSEHSECGYMPADRFCPSCVPSESEL